MASMKKYLTLKDISSYRLASDVSEKIWNIVLRWDAFARFTIGKQFVESVDSISANIAEGFGRYTKPDKIRFYRYSYGSISEAISWIQKAHCRGLISNNEYSEIHSIFLRLQIEVHQLIKFTNERLKK